MNRRDFLGYSASASLAASLSPPFTWPASRRVFTMSLRAGAVGIGANIDGVIDLAVANGFEAICPETNELAALDDGGKERILQRMGENNLKWGCAGLPVDFRNDNATFDEGMALLPERAKALEAMGVERVGTWLLPKHDELTYFQNYRRHVRRLKQVAQVLADANLRFGLEYVGPRTFQTMLRHNFVRSLPETLELIEGIGMDNVGVVLDSFHWFTAQDKLEEIKALNNSQVVACDLNDARIGFASYEQIDNRRMLPASTGVIDVGAFLRALESISYDGPVRAEPFNQPLNEMDDAEAATATGDAMKRAFATL